MSTVIVNKVDLDLVDINIEQTGEAQTDMFFQEPVLDHTRDYVVAVSELSVPIQEEPMLSNRSKNSKIMYIRRKIEGEGIDHADVNITGSLATFRIDNKRMSTPVDFIHKIQQFFYIFANYYTQAVDPNGNYPAVTAAHVDYAISASFSPSGIMSIKAPGSFWNRFFIELEPYGRELLGFENSQLVVIPQPNNLDRYILQLSKSAADVISKTDMFLANGNFDIYAGAWTDPLLRSALHSSLRYAEHRIRIELDADLAIPANILIEDGVQKMHYNIGSFAIKHDYSGSITLKMDNSIDKVGLHSPVHIGNLLVKSRTDSTTDWYTISNASNVQNMRLNVIMLRREWDRNLKKWELVRNRIVIDPKASWNATLKFVQTF